MLLLLLPPAAPCGAAAMLAELTSRPAHNMTVLAVQQVRAAAGQHAGCAAQRGEAGTLPVTEDSWNGGEQALVKQQNCARRSHLLCYSRF
jgi:hypothetical protein